MITIQVKANTKNAFKGLMNHFNESNKFRNRMTLKAYGVTQRLIITERSLFISWGNLMEKISNKVNSDFKAMIKEDQKMDFINHVNSFMIKQNVNSNEYEVIFKDGSE